MEIIIIFFVVIILFSIIAVSAKPEKNPYSDSYSITDEYSEFKETSVPRVLKVKPNFKVPSEENKIEYLEFLRDSDQSVIDYLEEKGHKDKIKDYILKRAFVFRWRHESLDFDYYKEMLDNRIAGRPKVKQRTKEEIHADLVKKAKPDGYKSTQIIEGYALVDIFEIAGITYEGRYGRIRRIKQDTELILEKESDNPFDKKAVRILNDYDIIGYVGRTDTTMVRRVMNYGYKAFLYDCTNDNGYKKALFSLYVKK